MALPLNQGIHDQLEGTDPDADAATRRGRDSSVGARTNALGLYIEQGPRDCRHTEQRMKESVKKEETTFVLRKPARSSSSRNPQPVEFFSSFSSPSSIPGVWPPSPSVTRSWKIANPELGARKRKRMSSDLNREHVVDATGMEPASGYWKRCRIEGRVQPSQPALGNPYGTTNTNQGTSPDYRMMLNLSDSPTHSDTALVNPFAPTTAQPLQAPTFQMLSALSRDQSLSPTVRNPSIGSLDSNDLSVACLAPAEGHMSVSFGRFGCSGAFSKGMLGGQDDEAAISAKKEEEKRLADVIESWMRGLSHAQTASRNITSRPGVGSFPTTTASIPVQSRYFPRNFESSAGLLDAVCEIATLAYSSPGDYAGGGPRPFLDASRGLGFRIGQGTAPVVGVSGRRKLFGSPIGPREEVKDDQEKETQGISERAHVIARDNVEPKQNLSNLEANQAPLRESSAAANVIVIPSSPSEVKASNRKPRKPLPAVGVSNRKIKTQSGATLALIVKESSPIDLIPFQSLTIGSWTRYPKTNLDDQVDTTFAYTPFENGDQRFSWAMFHANMHYRISLPFMSIQSLKCNAVSDESDAMALHLTLKTPPLFHVWDEHFGMWKGVSSFISTDDMLTHCLVGRRESLLPKVERILSRTCPTDSAAGMFAVPIHVAPAIGPHMFTPNRPSERVRPAIEVIDLVTPPRPATDVLTNPVTPTRDGIRDADRILAKKRLGKDSSRVKMSTKAIASKKSAPDTGSAQLSKAGDITQGRQDKPLFTTTRDPMLSVRASKTSEKASDSDPDATIEGALRDGGLPKSGTNSQLDQYSVCHTLPQDKNLHWMPGAGNASLPATIPKFATPIMIPQFATHDPYHVGSANMMEPFMAPNAYYNNSHAYSFSKSSAEASTTAVGNHPYLTHYPYLRHSVVHPAPYYLAQLPASHSRPTTTSSTPSSVFQVGSLTTIVDRRTSMTSQSTDISAAMAGREFPHQ